MALFDHHEIQMVDGRSNKYRVLELGLEIKVKGKTKYFRSPEAAERYVLQRIQIARKVYGN